jgi:hypothetical protein
MRIHADPDNGQTFKSNFYIKNIGTHIGNRSKNTGNYEGTKAVWKGRSSGLPHNVGQFSSS